MIDWLHRLPPAIGTGLVTRVVAVLDQPFRGAKWLRPAYLLHAKEGMNTL